MPIVDSLPDYTQNNGCGDVVNLINIPPLQGLMATSTPSDECVAAKLLQWFSSMTGIYMLPLLPLLLPLLRTCFCPPAAKPPGPASMEVCRRGFRLSPPLRGSCCAAPAPGLACGVRAKGHKLGGFEVLRLIASGSGGGSCPLPLLLDLNPARPQTHRQTAELLVPIALALINRIVHARVRARPESFGRAS